MAKELSDDAKKGMARFKKIQAKRVAEKLKKALRSTNAFGYGSYGPKQFRD